MFCGIFDHISTGQRDLNRNGASELVALTYCRSASAAALSVV